MTFQAPEAFSHPSCKKSPVTLQTIAIHKYADTFQTMTDLCKNSHVNALCAQGMYAQQQLSVTQSSHKLFFDSIAAISFTNKLPASTASSLQAISKV